MIIPTYARLSEPQQKETLVLCDGCFDIEDIYGVIFLLGTLVCLGVVLWVIIKR